EIPSRATAEGNGRRRSSRPQDRAGILQLRQVRVAEPPAGRGLVMRIAVVGAGGVGGGFGAALAKACADVTFIARGAHLAAMKRDGLKVQSARGDTHLVPTQATASPPGSGAVEHALVCLN